MRVSWWWIGGGVVVALLAVVALVVPPYLQAQEARRERLEAERAARQAPVAEVAPSPPPTSVPLLGEDGRDADGYPTRYVDRAALRALLWHRRYEELTRYIEEFQTAFEADPRCEYWPAEAAEAFDSAEPDLLPLLDAWVQATPESFAPYVARGNHWVSVAYARRGTGWARDTAREDFAAMEEALKRGLADLDHAITIRPGLVAARRAKMFALRSRGSAPEIRRTLDEAVAVCPTCFQVRVSFIVALTPRWGGSYDAMRRFAQEGDAALNPRFRVLPGYIDLDQADMLWLDGKHAEALAAIERACAIREYWEFLEKRARIRDRLNDGAGALADVERAITARPGHPRLLILRGYLRSRAREWELAGRDLLAGLRMAPTDRLARRTLDGVVQGLAHEGWVHYQAGRRQEALHLYDLAAELSPRNQEVQGRRQAIIAGAGGVGAGEMARLEAAVQRSPDDFRALQEFDRALGRRGEFERVIELWTAYLARHPQDGPAHLERGGAYFRLQRYAEARADAHTACGLGVSEGCAREKQAAAMQK